MAQFGSNSVGNRLSAEKPIDTGNAWRLMFFMLFVFLVFLVSYLGLAVGYRSYLKAQIEKTDQELAALAARVSEDQQDAFLKFQYQLFNLRSLLARHVIASRVFPFLEVNTNQRVQYTNFELNVPDSRLDLRGSAQSYAVLAEELAAYERAPQVLRYQIANSQVGEGGRVTFEVALFLDSTIFKP